MWDQPPAIHQLAAAGANLDSQDLHQDTPLHLAASLQQTRAIAALISAGAGLHSRNKDGKTPLHIAAAKGRVDSIKELAAAGAGHNFVDNSSLKRTPLALALQRGRAAAALELLLSGGNSGAHWELPLHKSTRCSLVQYFVRQLEAATTAREDLWSVRRNLAFLLMKYGVAEAVRRLPVPSGSQEESSSAERAARKAAERTKSQQQQFLKVASDCTMRAFCRGLARMAESIQIVRVEVASLEGVGKGMQQAIVLVAQAWREGTAAEV
jgi:hypothetical protein